MKTIAKQVLEVLKNITKKDLEVSAKYNKCLVVLEKFKVSSLRNDRVVNYTFDDNSVLTEYNEEDYGGSVTWYINDYEDFVEIEFEDYEDYED